MTGALNGVVFHYMATKIMPIPVEEDIDRSVSAAVVATHLCKLDVIRQALRIGVPAMSRLLAPPAGNRPAWQAYIDGYGEGTSVATGYKSALKAKLKEKHAGHR